MTQQTLPGVALVKIEYYSNNSGGYDWLGEREWQALRDAGWRVTGWDDDTAAARPRYARKAFATEDAAIAEFEALTGQDAYAIGCTCCGRPHEFRTLTREDD